MQLNCKRTNAIKGILHFFIFGKLLYVDSIFCLWDTMYCAATDKKKPVLFRKKSIACQHLVSFGIIVMLYFTTTVLYLVPTTVLYLVRGWDPLSIKERGCQQGRISKIIIVLSLMLSLYHHGHCSQRMLACKCKKGEVKYQSHKLVSN